MKIFYIVMVLLAPISLYYKRRDKKELIISFLLLAGIIISAIIGRTFKFLTPLILIHIIAILISYISYLIYIIRGKFYWYIYILPFITLLSYILIAFLGNRHISGF